MNSTPLRWSISCCRQVARRPSPGSLAPALAIEIFRPHLGRPRHLLVKFGDRQAALLVSGPLMGVPDNSGLMKTCGSGRLFLLGEVHGDDAPGTPTWMAASPIPGASYMVSNMSSMSLRSSVDFLTGSQTSRSLVGQR